MCRGSAPVQAVFLKSYIIDCDMPVEYCSSIIALVSDTHILKANTLLGHLQMVQLSSKEIGDCLLELTSSTIYLYIFLQVDMRDMI